MAYKVNDALANAILDAFALELTDFFIHIFAGPVPTSPDDALDMVNDHTELVIVSVGDDGTTGLTWGAAADGALPKNAAETWQGTASFDGADDGEAELVATFFRASLIADDARGAGSTVRLQGTIGATGSGADMERTDPTIEAAELVQLDTFFVRIGSLG